MKTKHYVLSFVLLISFLDKNIVITICNCLITYKGYKYLVNSIALDLNVRVVLLATEYCGFLMALVSQGK